jgi:hypothetical protein
MGQSLTSHGVTLDPREGSFELPSSVLSCTLDSTRTTAAWASATSHSLAADPVIDFKAPSSKRALEQREREDIRGLVFKARQWLTQRPTW